MGRLRRLEDRLLCCLAEAAEQVEDALGLPPLPDPPPADSAPPPA